MKHDYSKCLLDEYSIDMLQDGDDAITKLELWKWLKEFEPEENKGFTFSNCKEIEDISKEMKYHYSHSGFSFAWTMRNLQYVAKHGFDAFILLVESKHKD